MGQLCGFLDLFRSKEKNNGVIKVIFINIDRLDVQGLPIKYLWNHQNC